MNIVRVYEEDGEKVAVIKHNDDYVHVNCCGDCPYYDGYASVGSCEITDEVIADPFPNIGKQCPIFKQTG